jgi:predicted kinase
MSGRETETIDTARGPLLVLPNPSLVVLIGASGAGKSSFARANFSPYEILSSDAFRLLVANDESDQSASGDAFALLYEVAGMRLRRRLLTVADATSVERRSRAALTAIAERHELPAVAIVFDLPEAECLAHNAARATRNVEEAIVREQLVALAASRATIGLERFAAVHTLASADDVARARVVRSPDDRRHPS